MKWLSTFVFGSHLKHKFETKVNSFLVITVYNHLLIFTKFQLLKRNISIHTSECHKRPTLNFSIRLSNHILFFVFPKNNTVFNEHTISNSGSLSIGDLVKSTSQHSNIWIFLLSSYSNPCRGAFLRYMRMQMTTF